MVAINTEDIMFLGVVSLLAGVQLSRFARRCGMARGKFKVPIPETHGDPGFNRIFRAHQNSVEFFPLFLVTFWMAGLFFHQIPACLVALVYMYARQMYFEGYTKSVEERMPGFRLCVMMLMGLIALATVGLTHTFLLSFFNINLKLMVVNALK